MLRNRADRKTLAFVGFYYAYVAALWLMPARPLYVDVPLVALACAISWICAVITHNTLHCPVFSSRRANKAFQVALSCAYGFPVSEYVPGHNLSHHKHTQKPADLMRTSKMRHGWNVLNLLAFFPRVAFDILFENYRYIAVMKARMPRWHRQLLVEMAFVWGEKLLLLAVDWRKALAYIFVPHLFAVWGITTVNLFQHDGCDEDDRYNHSRNFVGRVFNWFTFNNGFHGIHHDRPGLHWSLTAEAHRREIHPFIHPALEQRSLLLYLVRTYLWPGRRTRFDGSPLVLPPVTPDAEWIPAQLESASHDLGAEGTALHAA